MNMPRWNIGIIGGGPGGLFTAYRLEQLCSTPLNISIFESSNRLGGKLLTEQFSANDLQYEAGAAEFYDYSLIDEDPLRELIEHFGLQTQSMGGTAIVQEKTVLGTIEGLHDSLGEASLREFIRFNDRAKTEVSPRQFYDSTSTSHINAGHTSLQEDRFSTSLHYLSHKTKNYIQQHIHSDLAAEPSQTSHRYGLDNYLMNDPAYMQLYSITGGNELLVHALACRLSANIRLDTKITTVRKNTQNTFELSWETEDGCQSEDFDAVVMALPIEPLKKIVFPDRELATAMQNHIMHHDHPADYLRITILLRSPSGNHGSTIHIACLTPLMAVAFTMNHHGYQKHSMEYSAGYSEALLPKKWRNTVMRSLHRRQSTLSHFRTTKQENFFVKPKYIAGSAP